MTLNLDASGVRLLALRSALLVSYHEEDLHQLRVTLRRMRSVLKNLPGETERQLQRALGKLSEATNSARDWDTLLARARDELRQEQLNILLPLLQDRQNTARAQAAKALGSTHWLNTIGRWEEYALKTGFDASRQVGATADIDNSLQRAVRAGRKASTHGSDNNWHRLRITVKELRYTLESLETSHPLPGGKDLLASCKAIQTQLGIWHDTVIHKELLRQLLLTESSTNTAQSSDALNQLSRILTLLGRRSRKRVKSSLQILNEKACASAHPNRKTDTHTNCC